MSAWFSRELTDNVATLERVSKRVGSESSTPALDDSCP